MSSLEDAKDNGSDLAFEGRYAVCRLRGLNLFLITWTISEYYGVETIAINVDDIMLGGKKLKDVYPRRTGWLFGNDNG